MELVQGEDLSVRSVSVGKLPVEDALEMASADLRGLEEAPTTRA